MRRREDIKGVVFLMGGSLFLWDADGGSVGCGSCRFQDSCSPFSGPNIRGLCPKTEPCSGTIRRGGLADILDIMCKEGV